MPTFFLLWQTREDTQAFGERFAHNRTYRQPMSFMYSSCALWYLAAVLLWTPSASTTNLPRSFSPLSSVTSAPAALQVAGC